MGKRREKHNVRPGRPVDWIQDDLLANGRQVVKTTNGFKTICPSHNDHDPSMNVSPTKNGNAIMAHCFACGAKRDALYASLGKRHRDYVLSDKRTNGAATRCKQKLEAKPISSSSTAQRGGQAPKFYQLQSVDGSETDKLAQSFSTAKHLDVAVIKNATRDSNGSICIWHSPAFGEYREVIQPVIVLFAFDSATGRPCGAQLFKADGKDFPPRTDNEKPKKRRLLAGSRAGLIFGSSGDRKRFFDGANCIVVESASDLLTAISYIPPDYVLVALSNGANTLSATNAQPLLDVFAMGGRQCFFIAHNDHAGILAFKKAAEAIRSRGGDARFTLAARYRDTPTFQSIGCATREPGKGFDLRDMILECKS